jgi:phage FluMu gp28-like protein
MVSPSHNALLVFLCSILLPYQQKWVKDKSPLRIWNKARQIGFSFIATFDAMLDMVEHKTLWIILSRGQRQSNELAVKAAEHIEAFSAIEQNARGSEFHEEEHWGFVDGVEIKQSVIHLPSNRSRAVFLPANPDTARGYTGNVLADEFALHKQAKQIYAAVFPSLTRGYRLSIGSTPFGESGMFWELFTKTNGFSKHQTTIYEAVEQGLQADIEMLRGGCTDDDIWEQEYCCKFISDATSWITWEQITDAESTGASVELPEYFIPTGELYLGGDIGRHKDLTVLCLLEKIGDVYWVRAIIRMRGVTFKVQREKIEWLMETYRIRRYCQDATGLGMQLAEEITTKFGESRSEGVTFTGLVKEDMAVRTRRMYEDKKLRTPDERAFRSAVHAVRRTTTQAGHIRFDAARTDAGHADEFWALSLALLAADGSPCVVGMTQSNRPTIKHQLRGF